MKKTFTVFDVLRFHPYRLFIFGIFISFIGSQMQVVGISWDLYQQTHSAYSLGFIGLAGFLPMLLSPFAGVLVDRFNKKNFLLINQFLFGILTLFFALLSIFHAVSPFWIYTVIFLNSLIIIVDLPL